MTQRAQDNRSRPTKEHLLLARLYEKTAPPPPILTGFLGNRELLKSHYSRLREMLREPLATRGFSPTRRIWRFVREKQRVEQAIDFPGDWDYGKESFRFNFIVCNRYLALEEVICGNGSREGELGPIIPHIASPIHLLRGNRNLDYWYLHAPGTVASVLGQLDAYGIPFLEEYASLEAVRDRLQSRSPGDPFILGNEARICLLAAIVFFEGRGSEALQLIDNALDERRNKFPKYRTQLEQLRARLTRDKRLSFRFGGT